MLRAVDAEHVRRGPPARPAGRPVRGPLRAHGRARDGRALRAHAARTSCPRERVFGEIEKLLLKARRPSIGLALMKRLGDAADGSARASPSGCHAPGPGVAPRGRCVDAHAPGRGRGRGPSRRSRGRPAARAHRDARRRSPTTSASPPPRSRAEDGHVRSPGHEEAGVAPTPRVCSTAGTSTRSSATTCARQVLALVADHLKPGELYKERARVSDGAIRRLARKCEPDLLYRVARADCLGRRPGASSPWPWSGSARRCAALDVAVKAARAPPARARPPGAGRGARARSRPHPPGGLRAAARRGGHQPWTRRARKHDASSRRNALPGRTPEGPPHASRKVLGSGTKPILSRRNT